MRKFLFLLLIAVISSCGQSSKTTNSDQEQHSQDTIVQASETNTFVQNTADYSALKELLSMFPKYNSLKQTVDSLLQLSELDKLNKEQIWQKIELRRSLESKLSVILDSISSDFDQCNKLDKIVRDLGLETFISESGFCIIHTVNPMLTQAEAKLCPGCALVDTFISAYEYPMGSEYIYSEDSTILLAARSGLQLFKNYKDTKYFKFIAPEFYQTIVTIADIHKYNDMCLVGEFSTNELLSIDCQIQKKFIEQNPNCNISKALKNLDQIPMSELPEFEDSTIIYAVVVDRVKAKKATMTVFGYLLNAQDILHWAWYHDYDSALIIYRFYPDADLALMAYSHIKEQLPQAQMYEIEINDLSEVMKMKPVE